MSQAFGRVKKDNALSNLQVYQDLTVKGTLRAREVIACGSNILSGSIGDVEVENAIINNATITNANINSTMLMNVNTTDFESGCATLQLDVPGGLTNITQVDNWVSGVDPPTTLSFQCHYYRVGRLVHLTLPVQTIILTNPVLRGTTAFNAGILPGRATPFPTTWELSGTGTIAKAGTDPTFGGMFAFAQADAGTDTFLVHWVGDSNSPGVNGAEGGAVTMMYETDGPALCPP